jgi:hyperosmotically inducible protein
MRLLADSQVPGLEIDLDSWDGVVTLFGIVSSQDAKAAAEADALKVSGVKRVVNELQVVASAKQHAVNARDDELQHEVRKALDEHEFRAVGLEVRNGVARLTGHVPTGARSLEAAVVARSIPGVRAVKDDLRLPAAKD